MIRDTKVFAGTYVDSVIQMAGTRAMTEVDGVEWAAAAMATPANLEILAEQGFEGDALPSASANDLFVAIAAADRDTFEAALAAGEERLFAATSRHDGDATKRERRPRSLDEAVSQQPGSNVAVVSVPGDFAALEAHKALTRGLHVLLFSDNVSVDDEIALKSRANAIGRLVMGPGAGTAVIAGTGLGFANVVKPGRVGVVAAAGTGAQEAMSLLDRWGVGVSQVIGVGGRDLTDAVDGRMAKAAVAALRDDPGTDAILLVSKPPSARVAREVVESAGGTPLVAALVGLQDALPGLPENVSVVTTLEAGVVETLRKLDAPVPDLDAGFCGEVEAACGRLGPARRLVRGLFSGGTLCYESLVILSERLGPVWSNTPLDKQYRVPAPDGSHVCLDLGEEEYTKGRPHPMIDPEARIEHIRTEGAEPEVAVVLLDVVLGYGSHPDPAGALAQACQEIITDDGPQVVAYVLGTEGDPQGLDRQRATLAQVGCIVAPTAARASLAAAALAQRRPELVTVRP